MIFNSITFDRQSWQDYTTYLLHKCNWETKELLGLFWVFFHSFPFFLRFFCQILFSAPLSEGPRTFLSAGDFWCFWRIYFPVWKAFRGTCLRFGSKKNITERQLIHTCLREPAGPLALYLLKYNTCFVRHFSSGHTLFWIGSPCQGEESW